MFRKTFVIGVIVVLALVVAVPAFAAGPSFMPAIYADGQVFSTKGLSPLPAPNDHNEQSFDKLYIITNGVEGQMPVSEAGPGNPAFNGGRWWAQTVTWTDPADAVLLTSYADILAHIGELSIVPGHPDPTHATYFLCPLLPVK